MLWQCQNFAPSRSNVFSEKVAVSDNKEERFNIVPKMHFFNVVAADSISIHILYNSLNRCLN